jgi:acyl-CoA synthetase (AMP-forming)/AMP-acid ligase II
LCGRKKDIVIVAGRNFYPQDIEEVVELASPKVRAGCIIVFDVEVDDQEAIVVLAEVREPKELKEDDLAQIASEVSIKMKKKKGEEREESAVYMALPNNYIFTNERYTEE